MTARRAAFGGWQIPKALPDLRRVCIVALDTETNDEGLRAGRGSAWPWRGGHVCGISVAYRADCDIRSHYFPLRHSDTENFDPAQVFRWLEDLVAADVRIVTQNGLYDWGWLRVDGGIVMPPSKQLEEIGALATIVDENLPGYSLDALCAWRGLPGKDETLLKEVVEARGFKVSGATPLQSYIWQLPAHLVGPYAEADAANTLALFEDLNPILDQEGTRAAYRLDVDLLPMVHEMRRRGIRIDQSAAEQARDHCLLKRAEALAALSKRLDAPTGMEEEAYPVDSGFPRCSVLSDRIGAVARADTDGEGAVARGIPEIVSRRGELRGIFDQAALAGWFCVSWLWKVPRGRAEKPASFA